MQGERKTSRPLILEFLKPANTTHGFHLIPITRSSRPRPGTYPSRSETLPAAEVDRRPLVDADEPDFPGGHCPVGGTQTERNHSGMGRGKSMGAACRVSICLCRGDGAANAPPR